MPKSIQKGSFNRLSTIVVSTRGTMKMYRTILVVVIVLAATISGSYNVFSRAIFSHFHGAYQVVDHRAPTDRNGCHEDGTGGYHCHR